MRICSSCGRENPDDADFCVCGEYLRWEPTSHVQAVPTPASAQVAVAARKDAAEAAEPPRAVEDVDPSVTLAPAALPGTPTASEANGAGGDGRGGAALTLRRGEETVEPESILQELEEGRLPRDEYERRARRWEC